MTKIPITFPNSQVLFDHHQHLVGGKAVNLAALDSLSLTIPSWVAISTEAFLTTVKTNSHLCSLVEQLAREPQNANNLAKHIRTVLTDIEIPKPVLEEIKAAYKPIREKDDLVAVRSSAIDEDSNSASFAGLHDSFLFVDNENSLLNAIRRVWASLFNDRALAYRIENKLPLKNLSIAVIIQQMINPETSGVAFTANPATNNPFQLVISSVYGVGEGLVSAGLPADTYTVDKETTETQAETVRKPTGLWLNTEQGRGLVEKAVEEDKQEQSSLNTEQILQLCKVCEIIETRYRRPQDIEFCFDNNGKLYVLQTRAITTATDYGPAAGHKLVWDNSNIIESYSGVTSPMTFSFIKRAYTIVYHCFAEVMGISPAVVRNNKRTFENMLGLFRGQVYYNIHNWYRLVSLFPGFEFNKQFMESMMGLSKTETISESSKNKSGIFNRFFKDLPLLIVLLLRTSLNFIRIRSIVRSFQDEFHENYHKWKTKDLESASVPELMNLYYEMEDKLLWNWKAPIINDFFVMVFYGSLKRLCINWCEDESGSLQNDLICGEGDIESTEPTKMLMRLSAMASASTELSQKIKELSPEALVNEIPENPAFSEFNEEFAKYLDRYGFRCVNELKLEEYSLRDKPHFVYQILKNYLLQDNADALNIEKIKAREQEIRHEAEGCAFEAIRKQKSFLPKTTLFRWVLRNARLGVKNRENMRFARTKIYGLVRELLRSVGDKFTSEGILQNREDIFYLTIEEVWDFVKGTAASTSLNEIANIRKKEFCEYLTDKTLLPDDHFETYGIAYNRNRFQDYRTVSSVTRDGELSGIGCCPGEITGQVKVIHSPSDDISLNGEILVAGRTDPGWVPLYPSVSGLLIERGSILSHSAIVAREMGIPTIVGIPNLLETISSGDVVKMNGSTGSIAIIED